MIVVQEERRLDDYIIEEWYIQISSLRWWSYWRRESISIVVEIRWESMITMGGYTGDREDYGSWRERIFLEIYIL